MRGNASQCEGLLIMHIMSAKSATTTLTALDARDAEVWVGGGWGVDALLGEQTRQHSDLDLWLDV